jgi:hypothetical protein
MNRPGYYDCKATMRIRTSKNQDVPAVTYIQTSGTCDHTRKKDAGLSTPVKQKIAAMDPLSGGRTARAMQRELQVSLRNTCS